MCFPFDGLKSLPPSVNNLLRAIPFSYEDKIHEHIQELEGEQREIMLGAFHSFLEVFEWGFLQIMSYVDGKQ